MPPPRLFAAPARPRHIDKRGRGEDDGDNRRARRSRLEALPPLPPLEGLAESDLEAPGDALAALMLLRQCWREDTAGVWPPPSTPLPRPRLALCPPLLLRTQVHSLVEDRASADREIDALRRRGVVRALRLPSSPTDVALVFESDYRASLEALGGGGESGRETSNDDDVAVAARALSDALPALPCSSSAAVPSSELEEVLLHAAHGAERVSRELSSNGDDRERRQRAVDALVAPLLRAGALSREHRCVGGAASNAAALAAEQAATAFVLSAPGAGPFVSALGCGRTGLERALRRKKHKEAPEASVAKLADEAARGTDGGGGGKTGLRGAAAVAASFLDDDDGESARAKRAALLHRPTLSGRFLVRDALGSGRLVRIRTTAGDMLRLAVERVG